MVQIDHVICPIDLSDCSRRALAHAFAWARWYEADLQVLHVVVPQVLLATPEAAAVIVPSEPAFDLRAEVDRFVADVAFPDVRTNIDVIKGDVTDAIVRVSEREPFSVLVMGTHGRTGLERFLIGSVTVRTLHRVSCPTLVVPPLDGETSNGTATVKRILCAVDFRPSSVAAFRYALSLAEELDAQLEVLHVVATVPNEVMLQGRPHGLTAYEHQMRELALTQIRQLIPPEAREWCSIIEQVIDGPPDREIVRRAEETEAQLIVMGSGERDRLSPSWLGLTTDRVIRVAPCPVLVVPQPHGD